MKKVNPNNVTHIRLEKGFRGVRSSWGYTCELSYLPEIKNPWWKKSYPAGYYKDGVYSDAHARWHTNDYYKPGYLGRTEIDVEGSLFTLSKLSIFSGKEIIHQEVFQTYEAMQEHVEFYYPECSVSYE